MEKAARQYLDAGLCVLPARRDQKRPTIAWKGFQTRLPTPAEVEAWLANGPDALCIIAGAVSVRAIQFSSLPGENVLDLFGGSGSTLIGCEQTGRRAFLMELDPLYCDVIVQRWEQFTGGKAERLDS